MKLRVILLGKLLPEQGVFAFHLYGNGCSLRVVTLLISQHAISFLNLQFPNSHAFSKELGDSPPKQC